jgi:hypothetical protein
MKKTEKEIATFIAEIKEVCARHSIFMVGTCKNQGIFGEITLFDVEDAENHHVFIPRAFNFDHSDTKSYW